jgi:hypothetical protein
MLIRGVSVTSGGKFVKLSLQASGLESLKLQLT